MIGALLKQGLMLATYATSARLVQESAKWVSTTFRGTVSRFATRMAARESVWKDAWKTVEKVTGDDAYERATTLWKRIGSGVATRAQARTTTKTYDWLSRVKRAAVSEVHTLPANYLMYRVERHTAVTPEEKEMTKSFTKYYVGMPMIASMGFATYQEGKAGRFKRMGKHFLRKLSPERSAKLYSSTMNTFQGIQQAASMAANYLSAAAATRARVTEGRSILSLVGKGKPRDVIRQIKSTYVDELYRTQKGTPTQLDARIREIRAWKKEQETMLSKTVESLKSKKMGDGAILEYSQQVKSNIATQQKDMIESFHNELRKPSRTMKFVNFMVGQLRAGNQQQRKLYRGITRTKRNVTWQDIGWEGGLDADITGLPKGFDVYEGQGIFNVNGQKVDFGRASLAFMKDALIKKFDSGIKGSVLSLFGIKDMLQYQQSTHALSTTFTSSRGGSIIFPKAYYDKQFDTDAMAQAKKVMTMMLPEAKGEEVDLFLKDRIKAYSEVRKINKHEDMAAVLAAAHGELLIKKGDHIVQLPGGKVKLVTNVGDDKASSGLRQLNLTLGGDENGGTMEFLKFTRDQRSTPVQLIRNFLGRFEGDVFGQHMKMGPVQVGKVLDTDKTMTFFSKLKQNLEIGYSKDTSMFSKLASIFTKHTDRTYPTTLFSKVGMEAPEFVENVFGRNLETVRVFSDHVRRFSQNAMDEFYAKRIGRQTTDEIVSMMTDISRRYESFRPGYHANMSEYLLTPTMGATRAKEKIGNLIGLLDQTTRLGERSYMANDMKELMRMQDLFYEGAADRVADTMMVKGSGRRVSVRGRMKELNMMDAYNSTTMRLIMGMNESIGREQLGLGAGKFFDKSEMMDNVADRLRNYAVGEKEISAFMASSHLSKMHHTMAYTYASTPTNLDNAGIEGAKGKLKDIITSMTGSTSYDEILDYYRGSFKYKPFIPYDHDSRLKVETPWHDEIYLIPKGTTGSLISRTNLPIGGGRADISVAQGTMDSANIAVMSMFHGFNRAAAGFLGIGLNEYTTTTAGQYFRKMLTKRVLPGMAMYMGYGVIDRLTDRYLDGTPLGEGLTVFGANILAGARIAAQNVMDTTGVTAFSKYMEDLLPGIISSPASGAVRGFGPVALGMVLGSKRGGPRGALMGGIVGSAMGMLLGGGPLGVFGCLPHNEPVRTAHGFKPIGEIEIGEEVYTKHGRLRKVKDKKISPPKDVVQVTLAGVPIPFSATDNHGIQVRSVNGPIWSSLGTLTLDDYVAFPAYRRRNRGNLDFTWFIDMERTPILVSGESSSKRVSLLEKTSDRRGVFKKGRIDYNWNSYCWPNAAIGRFIGWYIAEGSQMSKDTPIGISLAIHPSEKDYVLSEVILKARPYLPFGKVTYCSTEREEGESCRINISGRLIAELMEGMTQSHSGSKSWQKMIHPILSEVKSDAFLLSIIGGLLDGDGSVQITDNKITSATISTTSIDLAWDIWKLLLEFGIRSSVKKYPNYLNGIRKRDKINVSISSNKDIILLYSLCSEHSYKLRIGECPEPLPEKSVVQGHPHFYFFIEDDIAYFRVRKIERIHNTLPVYDLEIEDDSSFAGFGIIYHNSWDISKYRSEVIDELSGKTEIPIRKGRWWELSSTPFEGQRIQYFRPHIYSLTRSKYKETPGFKDSIFTEVVGAIAPDIYAMKNYYSRPYPVTAGLFSGLPVFGNMIGMLPGSSLLGGGIPLHGEEAYSPGFVTGRTAEMGINTAQIAREYNQQIGIYGSTDGSVGGFPKQDSIVQSFDNRLLLAPRPMKRSSAEWALGESISNVKDIVGLRGFLMGTAFTEMTGRQDIFDYAPELASPVDVGGLRREYWDLEMGGILGASEVIRRYIPHRRNQIQLFNPIRNTMPGYLPGKDYMVDFQRGDPYTTIPMGEARLPGPGYEVTHDVDLTFPAEAEMLGLSEESQKQWYLGDPAYMAYWNRMKDAVDPVREELVSSAKQYGEMMKGATSVYNPKYDVRATADAIMQAYNGQKTAVKVVPKGFAGESSINAFMIMSDVDNAVLLEVDPEQGGVTEKMVKKDVRRFEQDLSRARKSAWSAYSMIAEKDKAGEATNLANAYSWFDRFRILADVAPYSKEYREADAIVRQQMTAGRLPGTKVGEYYQAKDQVEQKMEAVPTQEYRFMHIGEALTSYGKAKDKFYTEEYNWLERQTGAVWERFTHLRTPLHVKMLHQQDPLEEYQRTSIYGKQIKMWQNPVEDFAKSYMYQMLGEEDPLQAAVSWATGGILMGGTPLAAVMGVMGVATATYNSLTGNVFVPDRVQERRDIQSQMDVLKYAKYKQMYMETGDRAYLMKAGRTITGAAAAGTVLSTNGVGTYLGYPEKNFVEGIINNVTTSNIHRVREILPAPAVATMYNMIGEPGIAKGMMRGEVKEDLMSRRLPGFESSIYNPDVPVESPAIRTFEMAGLDAHDAGMGWYDQMATLTRSEKAGMYNEGDTLYPTSFKSSVGVRDIVSGLDDKAKLRAMLSKVSSNVMIVDDGRKSVSLEVVAGL